MQMRKIWDGGVRLFHWSQVLLLVGLWWTAEQELFGLHMLQAYLLMSFIAARVVWGLVGSNTARFRHFVPTPTSLVNYLRRPGAVAGHNPLSALMIVALLLAVALQWSSGLFASDDLSAEGPLYSIAPSWLVEFADSFHHWWFNLILGLVTVHVLAAVVHQWRGDKVISAMISGAKPIANEQTIALKPGAYLLVLTLVFFGLFYLWQGQVVWSMVHGDAVTLGWITLTE